MSSVDAFLLGRTKIPRELHNAHFFSIHATKSLLTIKKHSTQQRVATIGGDVQN
jgi:hypothetical protein